MRIKNINNPGHFFEAVRRAKGSVELTTDEGDCLNLKSALCQYIALTQMFTDSRIQSVDILLSDESDLALLAPFMEFAD